MSYWCISKEAESFIRAARVPADLHPQRVGTWWIERHKISEAMLEEHAWIGFPSLTLLKRRRPPDARDPDPWAAEMSCCRPEVVMEDSRRELARHLPAFLRAHGRVLITGLVLGCVVRGLLASSRVEHIDVVELDHDIMDVVGAEFANDPRVSLYRGDALLVGASSDRWDFAWHDVCSSEDEHIQVLHAELLARFANVIPDQGAWMLPRWAKRKIRCIG